MLTHAAAGSCIRGGHLWSMLLFIFGNSHNKKFLKLHQRLIFFSKGVQSISSEDVRVCLWDTGSGEGSRTRSSFLRWAVGPEPAPQTPGTNPVFSRSCLGSHTLSFSTQKGREDWEQEQRVEERPFCSSFPFISIPLA